MLLYFGLIWGLENNLQFAHTWPRMKIFCELILIFLWHIMPYPYYLDFNCHGIWDCQNLNKKILGFFRSTFRIWSSVWVCGDFVSPLIPLETFAVDTPHSIGSLQKLNYLSWWHHFIAGQLEVTKTLIYFPGGIILSSIRNH